jgi:elongation factor Ts
MRKYTEEAVLHEQDFAVHTDLKDKEAIDRAAEKIGSSIPVTEMVRFGLGEGLETKTTSLAEEVAAQLASA